MATTPSLSTAALEAFEDSRFDGLFATAAQQQSGGVEGLFAIFFGFLLRKTDFFAVDEHTAKTVLDKVFHEAHVRAQQQRQRDQQAAAAAARKRQQQQQQRPSATVVGSSKIEELTEEEERICAGGVAAAKNADSGVATAAAGGGAAASAASTVKAAKAETETAKEKSHSSHSVQNAGASAFADESEDENALPPEGNGGKTDKYVWTQTLATVDVYVTVPRGTKASQLEVKILANKLKISLKGQTPIIDGLLHLRVKPDDCMWTLEDSSVVHVNLEKADNMRWWSCVIVGDPHIDTKKIVPENSKLSDLDAETRSTVEKMMYDQRQKAAGLPTSEQQQQQQLFEKFKKAHPELDFSKAKVNWGDSGWGGAGTSTSGGFSM